MRYMSASIIGVSTRDAFEGILAETLFVHASGQPARLILTLPPRSLGGKNEDVYKK